MSFDVTQLQTISDFLLNSAKKFPQKTALEFERTSLTYQQLQSGTSEVAKYICEKTTQQAVVAILLPNSTEFVLSYLGVLQAGCISLILAPNISDEKLIFQIKKTTPTLLISEKKYYDKLVRTQVLDQVQFVDVHELAQGKQTEVIKERLPKSTDTSTIIFTSGTTSEPKGVKLQHTNVVNATKNIIDFLGFTADDIDVNISALSHSFGLGHVHCILAVGGSTILFRDAINLKQIIKTILERKATTFGAVPAILRLLVQNYPDQFSECQQTLRFIQTNTSPLEKELIENILKLLPKTDFSYYYGLTEASRSTFITFNKHPEKFASVGQASPNVEVEVRNNEGKKCAASELGEICIKGKMVITEYWKNPEASRKVKSGWFHTGDVGYMDEDGFLYYKGRYNDIINVSGEKVSPEEVEEVIKKIPGIIDVGVIGIPDKILGEVIKACVSVSDPSFDTKLVIQACRQTLESFKVPREVEIVTEIPRTDNGKLKRNKLKKV